MDTMTVTAPAGRALDPDHPRTAGTDAPFFGENGFGFEDILDAINPLQHIPVVNTIYRQLTGDEISMGSRLAGGAVFGGPIGFVGSLANAVIEDVTGRDLGGHVMAMVWPGQDAAPEAGMAQATPVAAPAQTAAQTVPPRDAPSAEPAFLAALAPRDAAVASRDAMAEARRPARSAAGDVPTLSPAAMDALFASVNVTGAEEGEDRAREGASTDLAQSPADFAAWQAATQAWAAERQPANIPHAE